MATRSARRTLGELPLSQRAVTALAWGLISLPFVLPSVAWLLGWVRPPAAAPEESSAIQASAARE